MTAGSLVGRVVERQRLADLVSAARRAEGGALVVSGPAGIGKTTLLNECVEQSSASVVRCTGTPAEQQMSWAGLHQLLRPHVHRFAELPDRQRVALDAALGIGGEETAVDQLAVAGGTLSLLACLAGEDALVVVVDDVQWLDRPSADVVAFVGRRIAHDRIALVIGQRTERSDDLRVHGLPRIELEPLAEDEARALLDASNPDLRPSVVDRLLPLAAGHPLALVEAATRLTPQQALGADPLPEPLFEGASIEALYRHLLDEMPAGCRTALLLLTLAASVDDELLDRAGSTMGVGVRDVEPAETAGLVVRTASGLAFRHPLVGSAVRSLAPAPEIRRAHAALAAAGGEGDASVWHEAEAATTPDAGIAARLSDLGARELHRAPQTAERAFRRAAELAVDAAARGEAILRAAEACADVGSAHRASAYLEECLPLLTDASLRAEAAHLKGRLEQRHGHSAVAADVLMTGAAAIADVDPLLAASMYADALEPALFAGDPAGAYAAAHAAQQLAASGPAALRLEIDHRAADALGWQGEFVEATVLWRRVAAQIEADPDLSDDPWLRYLAGEARFSAGDDPAAVEHVSAAIDAAQRRGATSVIPTMTIVLTWALCRLGELDRAAITAADGVALAAALGSVGDEAWALAALAWADALRGDELSCRRHASDAEELAERLGLVGLEASEPALGALELSRGRHDAAVTHLRAAIAEHHRRGTTGVGAPRMFTPLLVEALVRAGAADEAADLLAEFDHQAAAMQADSALAASARCRGLLADDDEAASWFERSADIYARIGHRFDLARTQLCHGERLRRLRRRGEARILLSAAAAGFDESGAMLWRARALEELAATGERRRASEADRYRLTPQESQIAQLVATGMTNREVAARVFLSEKTIEAHLGRVFRKLGVRSRTALAAALAGANLREIPDSTGAARV